MNMVFGVIETDGKNRTTWKNGKLPYDQNWTHAVPN